MNKVSIHYSIVGARLEQTDTYKTICNVVQWIQVFAAGFDGIYMYTILMVKFIYSIVQFIYREKKIQRHAIYMFTLKADKHYLHSM